MKKWLFVLGLLNVAPHCAADLREDFNNLFQKGKYDQAERLLMEEGPSSDDPAAAADILKSLREFRSIDRQNECAIIIHNPTGSTLTYQTRWGDGEWADSEIEPFSSWRHRHPANRDGEPLRGRPHLRLTNLPEEAKQIVYDLHASVVAKDEWEGVNKYYFGPAGANPTNATYTVTGIDSDDTLNIRSGPGTDNDIVARLANGTGGIRITGDTVFNGGDDWVPVSFDNHSGWTRPKYLAKDDASNGPPVLFTFSDYSDEVAAILIHNDTENTINFKYRWKTSKEWKEIQLEPNYHHTFWQRYYPGVYVSPDFEIEFDYVAGDSDYTPKTLILKRSRAVRGNENERAKAHYFTYDSPSELNLYEK